MPNPRYRGGLVCKNCGEHVHVEPKKQLRHLVKAYLCQGCGEIVQNPAFQYEHPCEGCQAPHCTNIVDGEECGGFMAYSPTLTWKRCIMCDYTTPVLDSESSRRGDRGVGFTQPFNLCDDP